MSLNVNIQLIKNKIDLDKSFIDENLGNLRG